MFIAINPIKATHSSPNNNGEDILLQN